LEKKTKLSEIDRFAQDNYMRPLKKAIFKLHSHGEQANYPFTT
jgi:hypothetical protein